jgi:hypothetical protein
MGLLDLPELCIVTVMFYMIVENLAASSLRNHELQHCDIFKDIVMKPSLGSQTPAHIADFPKAQSFSNHYSRFVSIHS